MRAFAIGDRRIGPGESCFIIAEAGVNHNGDRGTLERLVEVAAQSGADAVKFQTFKADKLVTRDAPKAAYQTRNTGIEEAQYEMLSRLELSEELHDVAIDACRKHGILFLSTPFDESAADELEKRGMAAFKTPSGEITNHPYLSHVARKGRPMIVSTGMSTIAEVDQAVETIASAGDPPLALLHCTSNYPAAPADVNLRAMDTMAAAFGVPIGYSDHTLGTEISIAAVARGASIIEKHFTLDRRMPGPDHAASLEPAELRLLVAQIRTISSAMGDGRKRPAASERDTAAVARKSIVAARHILRGVMLSQKDLCMKRPGTGLPSLALPGLLGRRARQDIPAGSLISWEMVE